MFISIVICTYGRAAALRDLLHSLDTQTYKQFETLVIDGNEDPSPARKIVETFLKCPSVNIQVDLIASPKGLTRQRNVGIERAKGDLICFFDDDVTVEMDFLARVVAIFTRPELQDVGGITGYDPLNYPAPVTLRWRLRRALGVIPPLEPGGVDRLGRGIPLGFLKPFTGYKEVGLLSGFCMIFRRAVIDGLRFDEVIPTYGGEDRDFSMRIGWRSRLLICGDLYVNHHNTPEGRDSDLKRNFESGFGMGRRFAKYARGPWDYLTAVMTFAADLLIDAMFLLRRPSRMTLSTVIIRMKGVLAGLRSATDVQSQNLPREFDTPEQQRSRLSGVQ